MPLGCGAKGGRRKVEGGRWKVCRDGS